METITKKDVLASFVANPRQIDAALAAEEARKDGKSEEEVIEAAKTAYEDFAPQPGQSNARDYLLAICNLALGDFEQLDNERLVDVACLVRAPVHSQEVWQRLRDKIRGK